MTQAKRWLPILGALLLTGALVGLARLSGGAPAPAPDASTPSPSEGGGEGAEDGAPGEEGREEEDGADQYALLREILAAEESEQGGAFARTREAWTGRRVTWEMMRITRLCSSPGRCFVSPFDYARLDPEVRQGFLPELSMSPEQHQALTRACASHEPCVVRFEGTVDRFVFTVESPTRIHLAEVRFLEARAVREGEHWFRRHTPPPGVGGAGAEGQPAPAASRPEEENKPPEDAGR